ncbi:MAG: hypothetical protein JWN70_797 [Planctomycetaceae bacterium]|nr:hypothetical protein [Planctomycetaceae bacterium]
MALWTALLVSIGHLMAKDPTSKLLICPMQPPDPDGYRRGLRGKLSTAEEDHNVVINGDLNRDGKVPWLFFTAELKSALSPQFWGDKAATSSRSSNPKYADPLPPIIDFHQQLKAAGIALWIVPVPAKVAVYPQHCISTNGSTTGWVSEKRRIDRSHEKFYELLRKESLTVVDLTDEFRWPKGDAKQSRRFCLTDSHWSGTGVSMAAKILGDKVKKAPWYSAIPKRQFQTKPLTVEITGDLAALFNEKNPPREKLDLTRVFQMVDGKPLPVADDHSSPILLLGDSHTLIFHDPTLYAEGCGLADHLAEQLGFAMDVIGVRGSGANAARLNWRRRENPLAGKKLVIWCFSMREFTENTDGWRVLPMTKR